MRILDRYILKSVVTTFFSCIFLFLFLHIIIDVLSQLEDIIKQKADFWALFNYYIAYFPIMFVRVSPFACLFSTLYTFSRLNYTNEIIAMRAAGLSVIRVTKNVIIFGFLISAFVFWVSDRFVPHSLITTQKIKSQMEAKAKKSTEVKPEVVNNLSLYGLRNRLFVISRFYPRTNTMEGITVLEHDEHQNITKKIVAARGDYSEGLWTFYQCITYEFNLDGSMRQDPRYLEEEVMPITESPKDFTSQGQKLEYMNILQLDNYIWRLSKSGAVAITRKASTALYQRFTSPLTNLIIILLGIPFAFIVGRRASGLSSIGISMVMGFLYFVLDAVCAALGKGGFLVPGLAASLAHIIALSASAYLIARLP